MPFLALVRIFPSRKLIKLLDQIEPWRDSVLHRALAIQSETQKRLKAVKDQAQKQAVETKKAVAGAAWWLFNTGFGFPSSFSNRW